MSKKKVTHCPYCNTDFKDKSIQEHLLNNENCSQVHDTLMSDCWVLTEQFETKMNTAMSMFTQKKRNKKWE